MKILDIVLEVILEQILPNLNFSQLVEEEKKKDKAKKYFYKLLVNPKTTYLKYKEHLYVKFNNYLLSVKNLQEYIYSKDIKQVKNSKKKKKNLNNIICKYYNLIKN